MNALFNADTALSLLNAQDDFPVDFDDAWEWIGYSTKQAAKKKLTRNFIVGTDYLSKWMSVAHSNGSTASRTEKIYLTIDAFKSLGMMAGTAKGREIRKYFLECERIAKASSQIISQQNDHIRHLELEAEILRNRRWIIERKENLLTLHGQRQAAWICDERIQEVTEVIEKTVTVDPSGRRLATFDGVGIGYLTKRFGFKDNKKTWAWLESLGYGKDSNLWNQELTAVSASKLPREYVSELDTYWQQRAGVRQLMMGESA